VPRSLLTLLPVLPLDPAGGAQRSVDEISRMLAARGWRCSTLATTLTDSTTPTDLAALFDARGVKPHIDRSSIGTVYRFHDGQIDYTLLDLPGVSRAQWPIEPDPRFDRLLETTLRAAKPDVVHTFGASPIERQRQALCRRHGAAVVMALRTHNYYHPAAFEHADGVLTCSRFLTDRYRNQIGIESTPLPVPIDWPSTIAPEHDPVFITYVNPSLEKGVMFFARFADELASRRPDLPMLVFESRGTAGELLAAGATGGLDLRRHPSLMLSPSVPRARDIFAAARVLLVPSCLEEPAGRVIAEALVNGIPPLVANRGGMPEVAGAGGIVLPLPDDYTPTSRTLPSVSAVEPWIDRVITLCDDEAAYGAARAAARAEAELWLPERLATLYDDYFSSIRRRGAP